MGKRTSQQNTYIGTYLLRLFAHNSYFVKAKISADNILHTKDTHHADLDRGAPHGDLARQQGQE